MTATMAGLAPIDVSNPDLYQTDTWQEAFARLRAEDPCQYVPESRFGPYWSVVEVQGHHDGRARREDVFVRTWRHHDPRYPDDESNRESFIPHGPAAATRLNARTVAPIVAPCNLKNMTDSDPGTYMPSC